MKPYIRCSVLALLSLTLISSAFANTWYVDGVNGNDHNSCGTATSACKTITHAISLAFSGDTIDIAAATYNEDITIPVSLTLSGASSATTIIHAGPCAGTVVTIPGTLGSPLSVVNISGVTITGGAPSCENPDGAGGGGIRNGGDLTLTDSVVTGNAAGSGTYGGGIAGGGKLTINKSTISNNTAGGNEPGNGGGISCVFATMRITNSTISGNSALGFNSAVGGGIYLGGCPTTIISTTITGNSAGLEGGAISSTATLSINNSTITGNSFDGIMAIGHAKTAIQNSIVSGNAGFNCFVASSFISNGYNISSDDTCNFNSAGDMNNTDPMLGPLQNNGGPTATMAIKPGSPAIDAGNPSGCTDGRGHLVGTDQRGDRRPGDPKLKTGCDMGAYEYQFPNSANNLYVNGINGSDSNACNSATSACKTIGHAISVAASGDRVMVAPATYQENLTIPINLSIIGAAAKTTIIDGGKVAPVISVHASVTLSNLTIQNGYSPSSVETGGDGGGIFGAGPLLIEECIITNNTAVSTGGGVWSGYGAKLTITKSTVSGNTAAYGGGISGPGGSDWYLYDSTVSNNSAQNFGGGIVNDGGNALIVSSTIAGNTAVFGDGGIQDFGGIKLSNSTVSGNSAPSAGGLSGVTFVQNTIVSGNTGGNCSTTAEPKSYGYNLSSDNTCNFDKAGDLNNTDPMLGALKNNGGPTMTMAISPGSPAIDAGNPAGCTNGTGSVVETDQRHDKRPGDPKLTTGCDMGAYEYQFPK
jgi:hypothetical protein